MFSTLFKKEKKKVSITKLNTNELKNVIGGADVKAIAEQLVNLNNTSTTK